MKRLFAFTLLLFTFFAANTARAGTTPAGSGEKTIVMQPASWGLSGLEDRDNLMLIEFSSTLDRYSDGNPVAVGESYAVVWTPDNATFGGFDEQGNAVAPSKVIAKVPFAENGGCPHVQIRIDEEVSKRDYPGGTWDVYLLDTRVRVNGEVVGFGDILDYKKFNGTLTSGFGFVKNNIAVILEAGLKRPTITGVAPSAPSISVLKIDSDWIYLTCVGVIPGVHYGAVGSNVTPPGGLTPGGGGMPSAPSTFTLSDPVYITYNVKYDADGGSPTPDEVTGRSYDKSFALAAAPTKAGFAFTGWKADTNGKTYSAEATVSGAELCPAWWHDDGYTVTLTAQWKDASPTCDGGTIEKGEDGAWVVTPTNGAAKVVITGLAEGETVAGVRLDTFVVPSGAFVGFGEGKTEGEFSLALDEKGEVTIGTETIPVQPTIGKLGDGEEPFVVGEGDVTVKVKSIPGLRYGLWRGTSVETVCGGETPPPQEGICVSATATETTVTLVDDKPPAGAAFYRVVVSAW